MMVKAIAINDLQKEQKKKRKKTKRQKYQTEND